MQSSYHKILLLTSFCIFLNIGVFAQFSLDHRLKFGQNNTSTAPYLQMQNRAIYQLEEWQFSTNIESSIISSSQLFSGVECQATRSLNTYISNTSATVTIAHLNLHPKFKENYWNIKATSQYKHWRYALGLNFRTFYYTKAAADELGFKQRKYRELFGLVYHLGYSFSFPNEMELQALITNYDAFLVNQEMNPFLKLKALYPFSESATIKADINYFKAGVFNGSSNHFGYFITTGIQWDIN